MITWLKRQFPNSIKRNVRRIIQNAWQSAMYSLSIKQLNRCGLHHIVFVCQGNICRSAFAEHYLRAQLRGHTMIIQSFGLEVGNATMPPPEAIEVGKRFHIDLSTHRSKGLDSRSLQRADLIISMEYNHLRRLKALYPEHSEKTLLLKSFAPFPRNLACSIYDPFGLGQDEFQRCFLTIQSSIEGLMNYLQIPSKTQRDLYFD